MIPPGTIGDRVWFDGNTDGIQDPEEESLGGVPVYLYVDDGDGVFEPEGDDALVAQTVTNEDAESPTYGYYQFTGLVPGHYWASVGEIGWFITTPNPHELIDLQPGQVYLDADFGMFPGGG